MRITEVRRRKRISIDDTDTDYQSFFTLYLLSVTLKNIIKDLFVSIDNM